MSIALIGMSIIAFYFINENKLEYIDVNKLQCASSSGITAEAIEQAFIIQTLNSYIKIDEKVIKDLDGNEILFSQIVGCKPILFIRFSELNCNECITYILNKVRRLSIQKEYSDKVILLASYNDIRNLKMLINNMQLTFPVYLVNEINLPCEEINYPYCFICDNSLIANQVFVPDKNESKMTNLYFNLIDMKYFAIKNQ